MTIEIEVSKSFCLKTHAVTIDIIDGGSSIQYTSHMNLHGIEDLEMDLTNAIKILQDYRMKEEK